LHYVIGLVFQGFPFAAIDCAFEVEPDCVDGVGGESQFGSVELALFEELIEEGAAIALGVAVAGNKAADPALVFDRDLHEFAFSQKAVHSGVVLGRRRGGWGILPGRRQAVDEQYEGKQSCEFHIGIKARKLKPRNCLQRGRGRCGIYNKGTRAAREECMKQGPLLIDTSRKRRPKPVAVPTLLVTLEPGHRVFLHNLRDLLSIRRKPPLQLVSRPASFWPDVFVPTRMPWIQFLQSGLGHVLVIAALWASSLLFPQRPHLVQQSVFHSSDVVYYEPAEYVAPLNTGVTSAQLPKKGDPEHAAQPIISVPPEADNRAQTIVAPSNLKLDHDVPLPNIVAWARPTQTIPAAVVAGSPLDLKVPALPSSVVAPPPDVTSAMKQAPALSASVVAPAPDVNAVLRREVQAPQPAIVEPPREVEGADSRRLTDINIGHAQVVAPAPQLPVREQRALARVTPLGNSGAVVPPPPSVHVPGTAGDGRLIALNLHPVAPRGPVDAPTGNRRGTFAATPEGKPGAAGTPNVPGGTHSAFGAGKSSTNGVPPGLFVGTNPKPGSSTPGVDKKSSDSPLLASATLPRVSAVAPRSPDLPANVTSELERKVFGDRKSYAMILNVPNLNSSGGSWVMHFAELKDAEKPGDLIAPVATQEVDPGYPLELMRQNVQGMVMLSAVIRSDGSVGEVQILRGVDDRLDVYASAALSRWRFRPATRNGDPVAIQTVVMIPFRPVRNPGF
jgi:TonB family protein